MSRPAALDRILSDHPRVTAVEGRSHVALDHALVEGDPVVDHRADALHHGREVDVHRAEPNAELVRTPGVVSDLGGSDQSLGGDTPPSNSGTADRAALEECDSSPATPGHADTGPTAHPRADHSQIESLRLLHGMLGTYRSSGLRRRGQEGRGETPSPPPLEGADCEWQIALITGFDPVTRTRDSRRLTLALTDVAVVGIAPDEASPDGRLGSHHRVSGLVVVRARVPELRVAAAHVTTGRADPEIEARAALFTCVRPGTAVLLGYVLAGRKGEDISEPFQHQCISLEEGSLD